MLAFFAAELLYCGRNFLLFLLVALARVGLEIADSRCRMQDAFPRSFAKIRYS